MTDWIPPIFLGRLPRRAYKRQREVFEAFALWNDNPFWRTGASRKTLERRAAYGGRKGRRAAKRLYATKIKIAASFKLTMLIKGFEVWGPWKKYLEQKYQ